MPRRQTGREVVKAVMDYCREHSIPDPDPIARSALGQQARNLVKRGYDERDIRETAIDLASRFTLVTRHTALMTLQQTVTHVYDVREFQEHVLQKAAEREPVAPEVAGRLPHLAPVQPHAVSTEWRKRCDTPGCSRTALYKQRHCVDHEEDA